ncbi:hypothetical protein VTJ83DRAFT_7111 [Remersonia thermophila]|uniref:Metallo-beta-lactamase domain-containing protein n=1 Tax=Remersonia thermophila TaxID=72144 RepID=A0ABR4D2J6_9PEZI
MVSLLMQVTPSFMMLLQPSTLKHHESASPPEHHVLSTSPPQAASGWTSYLSSWAPSLGRTRPSQTENASPSVSAITGFRNPWPSWHNPTLAQTWSSFRWGPDNDGYLELAASHLTKAAGPISVEDEPAKLPRFGDLPCGWPARYSAAGEKAARLLRVQKPDFSLPVHDPASDGPGPGFRAKATWLGHAGALVQFPADDDKDEGERRRPLGFLFDPIFSQRPAITRYFGPPRTYPPPCAVQDLPEIDAVLISHNHPDHMDAATLKEVWERNKAWVRFYVPLGNARWLRAECGIPEDRVVEMDWWDEVELRHVGEETDGNAVVRIWCTPAQHNSWRFGAKNSALWSSWYVEHLAGGSGNSRGRPGCRVFFAGDTGYQFHPSPSWPPSPREHQGQDISQPTTTASVVDGKASSTVTTTTTATSTTATTTSTTNNNSNNSNSNSAVNDGDDDQVHPPCPAFAQIRARIGPPDLLLLPVSVGATFSYLRSFVPLPSWVNPLPRHTLGVTGANHMPSWDAVKVLRVMAGTEERRQQQQQEEEETSSAPPSATETTAAATLSDQSSRTRGPIAVAMHWGTFVPDPEEVLRTLGELEWACKSMGVRFARELGGEGEQAKDGLTFLALNHGASVSV